MDPIKTYLRIKGPEAGDLELPENLPFNKILDQNTTEDDLQEVINPLFSKFLDGYSATLLMYGQSGSGKTFSTAQFINIIMPQIVPNQLEFAFLEISGDILKDLTTQSEQLKIYTKPTLNIINLTFHTQHFQTFLNQALQARRTEKTNLNSNSSRSHLLIIFRKSTQLFILADLAGSERQSKAKTSAHQLQDGCDINYSLLVLSRVVNSLRNQLFVPFRDSKLTQILQFSIGGTAATSVFSCISNNQSNNLETLNTIQFTKNIGGIKNQIVKAKVVKSHSLELKEMQEKYQKLVETSKECLQQVIVRAKERENELLKKFKKIYDDLVGFNNNIIHQQNQFNQEMELDQCTGDGFADIIGFLGVKEDEM
ncbi:Kinesin-2 [Spironucleus salmonicida]|uniref:Kinesin-2 n=1 Tax=Spironucleus salmonicida TaxID=348837 RepID=V6LKF1_9EUKA|nr:Kinesin-2 [Spironucleus salmonicida]|eukprot:EST44196.1 Kinesin-2 [Spironucleus salmonicida]